MEHTLQTRASNKPGIAALDVPELYQCVHCGLCLNQCPTYRVTRLEPESPRGRIHLVKAAAEGRIDLGKPFEEHLYLCLLCRACESACPSGVQYGRIAEAAREQIGPPGSKISRAILNITFKHLLPYPRRLKWLARLLRFYQCSAVQPWIRRLLPRKLRDMEAMLPSIPSQFSERAGLVFPAFGARRARIAMLDGCIMPLLFDDVNAATLRVLRHNGCDVVFTEKPTCCGALNTHNGESAAAKEMARRNIDAFFSSGADAMIVNASGCGAAMKEYGHLLRNDPAYAAKAQAFALRVKDASEFLAEIGLRGPLAPLKMTVTYQDPCHLAHGQKVRSQPRQLLQAIPELRLIEMAFADRCCGSAGIYNITHPNMSGELLREKIAAIKATNADAVVAPNPGCMLQLRHGARQNRLDVKIYHLLDLLDQAYTAAERPDE